MVRKVLNFECIDCHMKDTVECPYCDDDCDSECDFALDDKCADCERKHRQEEEWSKCNKCKIPLDKTKQKRYCEICEIEALDNSKQFLKFISGYYCRPHPQDN